MSSPTLPIGSKWTNTFLMEGKKETYRTGEQIHFKRQTKTCVKSKQLTPGTGPSEGMGAERVLDGRNLLETRKGTSQAMP
jgi:hypothetical protein